MTFVLTVLADLTVAAEIGMLFAALLYIYRVSQTTPVAPVTEEYIEDGRPHVLPRHSHSLLLPCVLGPVCWFTSRDYDQFPCLSISCTSAKVRPSFVTSTIVLTSTGIDTPAPRA
jgi:SulP family sulfate permease